MPILGIDFQDGFSNDSVRVQVGGREVYRREGLTTDLRISRADGTKETVPDGPVEVTIAVPSRGLSRTLPLTVSKDLYLGVSVVDGALDIHTSDSPFYYM